MEYTLKKGNATATVSTIGGDMTGFTHAGKNYGWTGDEKYWIGTAPILFPNVCALKDDTITIAGKPHTIQKHGFARKSEMKVLEHSDEQIIVELCDSDSTRQCFPFEFSLKIKHTITDNGFTTEYSVTNKGSSEMVFCIGGHPGFFVTLNDGDKFSDYSLVFEKPESDTVCQVDPTGILHRDQTRKLDLIDGKTLKLDYELFKNDALIFENTNSGKVSVLKDGKGFEFDYSGYPVIGVWTPYPKNAPFLCLEPWHGLPAVAGEDGSFENKPHAIKLAPNKEFKTSYSLKVID